MKLLDLKEMVESINSGYSSVFLDIEKIRISYAHENVNEYAFYMPANPDGKLCELIGKAIRYLELAALDIENVKDLIFSGEILSLEKLLSMPPIKNHDDLDKLFSESVMLIRIPIELFYDNDKKIVLYYSFGYEKYERTSPYGNKARNERIYGRTPSIVNSASR